MLCDASTKTNEQMIMLPNHASDKIPQWILNTNTKSMDVLQKRKQNPINIILILQQLRMLPLPKIIQNSSA